AAEDLGYSHVQAYDHVVGADTRVRPGWNGPYDLHSLFHEPMVLFGYLAGLTERIELVAGVLILPQRQTVLVAKQAAEVDVLSGGRFRLGVGIGWNMVEYEALGANFHNRGKRSEEQIALLRALFVQESVNFVGHWEHVHAAGVNPLPVQRPIPVWFGAQSRRAYIRAGQLADGWFPQVPPGPRLDEAKSIVAQAAAEAGRDPAELGMEGRVSWGAGGAERLADHVGRWRDAGATHVSVNTMGAGLATVEDHLAALSAAAAALGLSRGSVTS
ncbi:MAG TPA: LLM class F420-dependent oxidoreductase, partial [Actinobacteria bacterium]|nr:LLM class F420-dependent oxidoreductase [Actinomycetota bacterium]